MPDYKVRGVVIRKKDVGEADRLLTVFTKDRGKIKILAKGVRKINSRRSGSLDLLNEVELVISGRNQNIGYVKEVSLVRSFGQAKKDLQLILRAYYLCEIVDRLCAEEDSLPDLYQPFVETLSGFNQKSGAKIWRFERQLLRVLGFLDKGGEGAGGGLRAYIEEILERKLKTPDLYYKVLAINRV